MGTSGYIHLDIDEIKKETDKAFLIVIGADDDDREEVWLPKSQCADPEDYAEGDKNLTISVSEWWAGKNDLA